MVNVKGESIVKGGKCTMEKTRLRPCTVTAPRFQVFINEGLAGFLFCWVEWVYFSDFRNKGVLEFDGMIERAMWRENVIGLFREDIGKG